jgi:hypothetical protein
MELKDGLVWRKCHCGGMSFPVTDADAIRYDAGKAGLRCGNACWGIYLARRGNNDKGNE